MRDYQKILSDTTVLILSHNRQDCLSAALKYWEHFGIRTIVLDESPSPLTGVSRFSLTQYKHIKEPFSVRCRIAADLLNTKYSIVISDDEVYLPSGLVDMRNVLEENIELGSVGGVALAIWEYGPQVSGSWPYTGTYEFENREKNSLDRIKKITGDGTNPHSAFFTSNLNRTEHLKRCLKLYAQSPVIATEAMSILSICAAAESVYINSLFWIRNWNEFPKSHAGWDRNLLIHDWWREQIGTPEWHELRSHLIDAYKTFSKEDDFDDVWRLIISASEVSQPKSQEKRNKIESNLNPYLTRFAKYYIKRIFQKKRIPPTYKQILNQMSSSKVRYKDQEVNYAVEVVRKMRPYKNWN